jgi:preprotein translocase subunit SecG
MYTFLFTLLVLDALVLIVAILLQAGKGSGLAASFGGASSAAETVIGSRQAGNLLTKTSWWAGGIFLGLSFILQLSGARARSPRSVLDQTFNGAPAGSPAGRAPVPGTTPGAAPAVPLTPAAPPAGTPPSGAPPATTPPAGTAPAPR